MGDDVEEAFLEGKVEKKSNKKKSNEDNKDGLKLSKEGKRKKENRKAEDLEVYNEAHIVKKDHDGAIHNHQKESSKRKTRRKLEHNVNDLGTDSEVKTKRKEKNKKRRLKDDKDHSLSSQIQTSEVKDDKYEIVNEQRSSGEDDVAVKKSKKNHSICDLKGKKKTAAAKEGGEAADENNVDAAEKVEKRKRKKENRKAKDFSGAARQETLDKDIGNGKHDVESKTGKKPKPAAIFFSDLNSERKLKKVTFSGVEVFSASDSATNRKEKKGEGDGLVQGKRFTPEEDEIIKEAVMTYIQVHGLGEVGLQMVLNCKSNPKTRNCWKDITPSLPRRPYKSTYRRAHSLFERGANRTWSAEELQHVKKYHEQHGPKWKELADALGKHNVHVRDAWRRIKLPKKKKGHWSQDEYQNLFNLVNKDLRMKIAVEKKSKHGMLRDNIGWTAISDTLQTRGDAVCCKKWYNQLTSPMVQKKIWADVDDYHMLQALCELDACCVEDVDWDNLLEHRPEDVCRRRWDQMYNHIGEHGCESFADQVEVLLKRYCPDVLEAREIWDNKPVVS